MKKRNILSLLAIVSLVVTLIFAFTACGDEKETHTEHTYGAWTITVEPTLDAGGKAKHDCTGCDHSETVDIPALSNSEVWTKSEKTPATHTAEGVDKYTSVYGTVEAPSPKTTEHVWGAWSWKDGVKPTIEAGATAVRTCTANDDGKEEVPVPALTDSEVWTKSEKTPATHTAEGVDEYTSVYGTVEAPSPKTAEHTWGAWSWKDGVKPTLESGATAVRTCTANDGGKEEVPVPALTDSEVWTKSVKTPATHTTEGVDEYTSVYGKVEAASPKTTDHVWGAWSWVEGQIPTTEKAGKAEHTCTVDDCGVTEQKDVPALTDDEVWMKQSVEADYNHVGTDTYTSEYGEVTVESAAKLVAPYDGKTYTSFDVDASDDKLNKKVGSVTTWANTELKFDAKGTAVSGGGFLTNYALVQAVMDDYDAGKMHLDVYDQTQAGDDENPPQYATESKRQDAVFDLTTGLIVLQHSSGSFTCFDVLTTYGVVTSTQVKGSSWGTDSTDYAIVVAYTYQPAEEEEETTINILVWNDEVYFGVTFTDLEGKAVEADACYQAPQLYVKKGEDVILAVGYDGEKVVPLDGAEGIYTAAGETDLGTLTFSGYGTLTFVKDDTTLNGTYKKVADEDFDFDVFVEEDGKPVYYLVHLDGETYEATKTMVTVTYNANGHGTAPEAASVNKNIPAELATIEDQEDVLFRGWYLDDACTQPVELDEDGKYAPAADVTLYAKWAAVVTVTVYKDGADKDPVTAKAAVGDDILAFLGTVLPNPYQDGYILDYWYVLLEGEAEFKIEEGVFEAEDAESPVTIYAKWKLAPYIGVYEGANIYAAVSGSATSSSYHIEIAQDGTVSGKYSGKVLSYNQETGLITVQDSSSQYFFFFNEATGTLTTSRYGVATGSYIEDDIAFYGKNGQSSFNHQGISVPNPTGGSSTGYYARFVDVKVGEETVIVLCYNDRIWSGTATDAFGNVLKNVEAVKAAKTFVFKDTKGEVVLAKASLGANFSANSSSQDLDALYGVYTLQDGETLKLDGAGSVLLGSKSGTYALQEGSANVLDVFVTEQDDADKAILVYYQVTLDVDAKTYTIEKPMISVTLHEPTDKDAEDSVAEYNKNIQIVLPTPEDTAEYVFRGWYSDAEFDHKLDTNEDGSYIYTPTETATLYAKWLKKVTITIVYNDGEPGTPNKTVTYGQTETAVVPRPAYEGHKFLGWFTDNTSFEQAWGTQSEEDGSTSLLLEEGETVAYTIYAKWGDAPVYSHSYYSVEIEGDNDHGTSEYYVRSSNALVIDPEGHSAGTGTWPFNRELNVKDFNEETGRFYFAVGSDYGAIIDLATGIIIMDNTSGSNVAPTFKKVSLLVPSTLGDAFPSGKDETKFGSTYWDGASARAITFIDKTGTTHNIFILDGEVYFGVSFKDKLQGGADVFAGDCLNGEKVTNLYVFASDGEEIARFGFNGTTMVQLDGKEGDYTFSGDGDDLGTLNLNGVDKATLTKEGAGVKNGTYALVEDGYTLDLFIDGCYYQVTLEESNYSYVKPMVTVTFTSENGYDYGEDETWDSSKSLNTKVEIVIPKLNNVEEFVFRGWFTSEGFAEDTILPTDKDGNYLFTPTEATTLYAKWVEKVTVTVHYQKSGWEDVTLELGKGECAAPVEPTYTDGQVFKAWHLGTAEGNVWTADTPVTADIEIYCEWMDSISLYGSWTGKEIWSDSGHTGAGTDKINISTTGEMTGLSRYKSVSIDDATGQVTAVSGDSTYCGYYDAAHDILVIDFYSKTEGKVFNDGIDVYVFVHRNAMNVGDNWGFGPTSTYVYRLFAIDGTNYFIFKDKVYGNVTLKGATGDVVTIAQAKAGTAFTVWDDASVSKKITGFGKSGSGWIALDGYEGTYTIDGSDDFIVDGNGGVSWKGVTGTYEVVEENKLGVMLEKHDETPASYWEITLNVAEKTATKEQPMVSITVNVKTTDGVSMGNHTASFNKNVPVDLSELLEEFADTTEGYVCIGWYTDEGMETAVTLDGDGLYVPKGDVTLYAKMAETVTVTVKYAFEGHGTGLEDGTLEVPKTTIPDLTSLIPEPDGQYIFSGWFTDAGRQEKYVPAPIDGDLTLYCGWVYQPYSVEVKNASRVQWVEEPVGTWRADCNGNDGDSAAVMLTITFTADGTFKFDWKCNFYDSDSALLVAKQTAPGTPPHSMGYSSEKKSYSGGNGTHTFEAKAGDVLMIEIWIYSMYGRSGDYAQVSNFQFALAE